MAERPKTTLSGMHHGLMNVHGDQIKHDQAE